MDQAAAQGGAAGLRIGKAGQGADGAQQVAGDGGTGQLRSVRGKRAGWHVRERPVGDVGEDLLHDRVVAVLAFGLDQLERGVGEDRVVAPGGE
jgi:hypothetical protein